MISPIVYKRIRFIVLVAIVFLCMFSGIQILEMGTRLLAVFALAEFIDRTVK